MLRYRPQLKISHGLISTENFEIFCSCQTRVIYIHVKEAFRTESFKSQKELHLLMQMHVKNTLEIHFVYLGNKEIYCIFMVYCIISFLFSIKCWMFYNFVFFFSNNTFFNKSCTKI
jgi:hypothetical protein